VGTAGVPAAGGVMVTVELTLVGNVCGGGMSVGIL
jgi:hypothetical protein